MSPEFNIQDANKLIFIKRYDLAASILEDLASRDPGLQDMLLHLRRIELAAKLETLTKTIQTYRAKLEPGKPNALILMTLAELYAEEMPPAEAASVFQEILSTFGPIPAAYYGLGFAMESQGNLERAAANYQRCVEQDPNWYPAYFGLSQVCYQTHQDKRGDQYFFIFEEAAPFNVYGNFETHRKLSKEYLQKKDFAAAKVALTTLSEWWLENKGSCPPEILIHEAFSLTRILDAEGQKNESMAKRKQALTLAREILVEAEPLEGALYFIAKTLEEFAEKDLALLFYQKILSLETASPQIVQKIGGQFLTMGDYETAKRLFDEAYLIHPDHPEIRFCQLIATLKLRNVPVEDYLVSKERMRQGVAERVEQLSLIHSLLAKNPDDAEVQGYAGELYLGLASKERAAQHFAKMLACDPLGSQTLLRYAAFEMQHGDPDAGMKTLAKISPSQLTSREARQEMQWLQASFHFRKKDDRKSLAMVQKLLLSDPWNVSYLVMQAISLQMNAHQVDLDITLQHLHGNDETALDWADFDEKTNEFASQKLYELVYAREKLAFLYEDAPASRMRRLVLAAQSYDPTRCQTDLLRLLNTNFDNPLIYWGLATLCKEAWQLEASSNWFEQLLRLTEDPELLAECYTELADNYLWQGHRINKATELARLAVDLNANARTSPRALLVLSHALLKAGQVRQAQAYLEKTPASELPEARYLLGLIHFRNGDEVGAKEIWKPLIATRSETRRSHQIKQEILRFYYDGDSYLISS